jgi:rare lipoprotein A
MTKNIVIALLIALSVSLGLFALWPGPSMAKGCAGSIVKVSYYGKETCRPGRKCQTADETDFDGTQMLAAHRTLPFGTIVKFTYNGRTVKLPIRDRGPFVASRTYDLSEAAARKLGFIRAGVVKLCAERLG